MKDSRVILSDILDFQQIKEKEGDMKKFLKLFLLLSLLAFIGLGANGGCGGCGGDTVKPQVIITEPTNNSIVLEIVPIKVNATDNVGVSKVEFYVDNNKIGETTASPYVCNWDTSNLQYNSTHTIQAKAYDAAGNVGESPVITVKIGDIQVPEVTITRPQNGDVVYGTVLIQAQVIERSPLLKNKKVDKAPSGISKVELYIDDMNNPISIYTQPPYEYNWNTSNLQYGSTHTIKARAYDNAGNMGESPIITVKIGASPRKWNFLVYMDGDNDLETYAIMDVNEMEQVGSNQDVNIIVLLDRIPGNDTSNGNWTTTRIYYITRDSNTSIINSTLLADLGECDMSNPDTLSDFITYCQNIFPAEKTCLTLWDKGGGVWPRSYSKDKRSSISYPSPMNRGTRGLCWDDTTGTSGWNCLTTDEVATALNQARIQTGKKVDVINTDTSSNQMIEVAYEWRNEVNFLVGSESVEYASGSDYATVLEDLTSNPNMSAQNFAKTLVDDYQSYYTSYDTTYSYVNLGTPFTTLINSFKNFAEALYNTSDLASVDYVWWSSTTYFDNWENLDLYDLADDLSNSSSDTAVRSTANTLKTAISNAVYYKNTGIYASSQWPAYGLAVLLPTDDQWAYYSGSNQYVMLALSRDTKWDEFILRFVAYESGG